MLSAAARYKLSLYEPIKPLHETADCRVELVKSSLDGREYIKKIYHGDKRLIFEALMQIKSQFIPQIYEIFFGEDTIVIEEYAAGENLGELAKRGEISGKALSRIADELMLALQVLHENKIIHRDVKPENLILTPDGVKLIDYGIARLYDENETRDTEQFGTRGYAAPEQYGFAQSGPQADLYAFGKTIEALSSGLRIDGALARAAAKCARFDPDDRFSDAAAVRRYIRTRRAVPKFTVAAVCACAALWLCMFAVSRQNSVIYGADDERVAIQADGAYCPALLLTAKYGKTERSGAVSFKGGRFDVHASMDGNILSLALSDGKGHDAMFSFEFQPPERKLYSGRLSIDGEITFFDLNGDGVPEIFPVIAERRKVYKEGNEELLMYLINKSTAWCVSYDSKKGFAESGESISTQNSPMCAMPVKGAARAAFGNPFYHWPIFLFISDRPEAFS